MKKEPIDPLKRLCEYCEEPMPLDAKAKARFCCRGCESKYSRALQMVNHPNGLRPHADRSCAICGDLIASNRKYCWECTKRIISMSKSRCSTVYNKLQSEEVRMRKEALAKMSDEEFYQEVTKKMMERIEQVNNE